MQNNSYGSSRAGMDYETGLAAYSRKTFLWMFIGLAITFGISFIMASNGGIFAIRFVVFNFPVYIALCIIELVLVAVLGAKISKLPPVACTIIFLAYSAINGFTIAPALIAYEFESVIYVFAVCAGIFGALAAYGYMTKRNLAKLGPICTIGLIGILIFSIIGIFINMDSIQMIISIVAIIVFMGFTMYDVQKIKKFYEVYQGDDDMIKKTAIYSALQLYLDFINIFLYLLRLFGNSKR